MILNAINKKQTFNELIGEANAMVTSVLNDNLKWSINVLPSKADFGVVKAGQKYEITITVKNEDMLPSRINVKQLKDKWLRWRTEVGGPIAPGMMKKVILELNAWADEETWIWDEL